MEGKGSSLGPRINPGPPYAVGDVIMCDVPGASRGLQRAFVLWADHPNYRLRLEEGWTVTTHIGESWLWPGLAPGRSAKGHDDPFANVRDDVNLKMGSYGMQVDSQLISPRKIKEAKEFAKAVKADNANIPVYLWNDRITSPGIMKDKRDAALVGFRKLGQRVFMQGLVRDCLEHMQHSYRPTWASLPRAKDGGLTDMG